MDSLRSEHGLRVCARWRWCMIRINHQLNALHKTNPKPTLYQTSTFNIRQFLLLTSHNPQKFPNNEQQSVPPSPQIFHLNMITNRDTSSGRVLMVKDYCHPSQPFLASFGIETPPPLHGLHLGTIFFWTHFYLFTFLSLTTNCQWFRKSVK